MNGVSSVNEYMDKNPQHAEILHVLRQIIIESGLQETIKWGAPCYTLNKKNVVGLASFKSYVGLWFHQGAFLKDPHKVLINAQEGVTKALRQWRFEATEEINVPILQEYLNESISNEKAGKRLKPIQKKMLDIPVELLDAFSKDKILHDHFNNFTSGKQREFVEYIAEAKLEKTRQNRLQKILPLIRADKGLNDKYRK
jgi:uncharacterized protein YdeI (YjbR/CyaY-like superfamily)